MSNFCEICSLELQDSRALNGHLAGKKHERRRQQKEVEQRMLDHSIFVYPIPRSMSADALIKYFYQFGQIHKFKIGTNHLILEFTEREPVDYLLKQPIWIMNTKLDIKRIKIHSRDPKKTEQNFSDEAEAINFDSIRSILEKESTFDGQLAAFLNAVHLNDLEVEKRFGSICTYLDNIFARVFRNCRTYRFGSTQSGLAFKDSDLDIYMDLGAPICEGDNNKPGSWTMQQVFRKVKLVMRKMSYAFTNIVAVPKAKIPIIKFYHIPTKISCDISFKNGFGVYNSQLIKHCLSLDPRIKPLMIIMKYWGRECKISGSGKMSNYALIMLVIFYLQQPNIGILPALMEFQKTCTPKIINGWQVNFDENTVLPPITNTDSIAELLQGFFEFYSTFEFETNMICPSDGIIHGKQEFNDTESLPNHMARYKEIAKTDDLKLDVSKFVCIQDPFVLNRNIATCTSKTLIESFQTYCQVGSEICISSRMKNYKNLLESLFTSSSEVGPKFVMSITCVPYRHVKMAINLVEHANIGNEEQCRKEKWYFLVFGVVKDIFEKVYRLRVEVLYADKEAKQQKIETLSDVHTQEHRQLMLHCVGNQCLWRYRKSCSIILDPKMNALDKEESISSQMLEENPKRGGASNINLDFICQFEKKEKPLHVQLVLTNKNTKRKLFNEFGGHVVGRLPKLVRKMLPIAM